MAFRTTTLQNIRKGETVQKDNITGEAKSRMNELLPLLFWLVHFVLTFRFDLLKDA